jgi:hypothetical protein
VPAVGDMHVVGADGGQVPVGWPLQTPSTQLVPMGQVPPQRPQFAGS